MTEMASFNCCQDQSGRRGRLLHALASAGPLWTVLQVPIGTQGYERLMELRRPYEGREQPDADLAEHEAIAVCATERRDLIFVCQDRRAIGLALDELGPGRVATPYDLWEDLRRRQLFDQGGFEALCKSTRIALNQRPALPPWRLRRPREC
jgi:hypothetical protein